MRTRVAYAALGAAIVLVIFLAASTACDALRTGAVSVDEGGSSDIAILIAPYRVDVVPQQEPPSGSVHLISREGTVLHTWRTKAPVVVADLQEDGTLYVSMTPAIDHRQYPGFGATGVIQQLDWEGNVLWEHRDPLMTLDFDLLPDGSVAYLRWGVAGDGFARMARGGFPTATSSMWTNDIVVVDKSGRETWTWRMSEHLAPENYEIDDFSARQEFSHSNSLRYVTSNPLTHVPAFVMSARHISKALIIDMESKEVAWESPDGLFALQHDATLLQNGNLLAFDNGFARDDIAALLSRAVEVSLPSGEVVWQYDGGISMTAKAQVASSIMGGAQRLSNGNTLITVSTSGAVLEVTPEGRVVWDYRYTRRDTDGELPILFRARAYELQGTSWAPRLGLAATYSALACRR